MRKVQVHKPYTWSQIKRPSTGSSMLVHSLPGIGYPFVFEFRLPPRILNGLVPGVGDRIPLFVTAEEVERILALIPADRQARSRTLQLAGHLVATPAGGPMPF